MPSGPSDITRKKNAFDGGESNREAVPHQRLHRKERKEGN